MIRAMQSEVASFGRCFRPQSEVVPLPTAGFSFAAAPVLLCAPVVLSARALLHALVSALTDPSVRRVLVTVR